ncbi:MAG: hypothetical protein AMK75_01830 [Planctomycetes bacterium SM23_65]|nr:MAG: hypothetical protein AMK75_01830 [Planctomycetes bacterium SM23_65]
MRLLLLDSDGGLRRSLARRLQRQNCVVSSTGDAEDALRHARSECFDVVLADVSMPGIDALELLEQLQSTSPETPVIVLTEHPSAGEATSALKGGAFAVLRKPCGADRLIATINRASELVRLRRHNLALQRMLHLEPADAEILGESRAIEQVRARVARCAATNSPVLIEGESGTEKDRVARAIWRASPRKDRPFIVFNAAAVPREEVEDELFGHERGAFAGATRDRPGILEAAQGGTIFMEEIAGLDLSVQTELLRLIEHGELRRVGASQLRRVDVRFLLAVSRRLEGETKEGRVRSGLFYRLNPPKIRVPPLRERVDDIPLLVAHLLKGLRRGDEPAKEVTEDAMGLLQGYDWPGNVRELANVIERAVLLSAGAAVTVDEIRPHLAVRASASPDMTLEELERQHVVRALHETRGNKTEAAKLLGIGRRKLYHLIQRHGLNEGGGAKRSGGDAS